MEITTEYVSKTIQIMVWIATSHENESQIKETCLILVKEKLAIERKFSGINR